MGASGGESSNSNTSYAGNGLGADKYNALLQTLDLQELQDVAAARCAIWAQIKVLDDSLWKSFSRVEIAKENKVTLKGLFYAS